MGLFDIIFTKSNSSKREKQLPWISLTNVSQLEEIQDKSKTKTQILFKHSTRCGISSMVKRQFEKDFDFEEEALDLYYLDLLSHRDVSNAIQEVFDVQHQSPQLIIVRNQQVVAHASHGSINDLDIATFL